MLVIIVGVIVGFELSWNMVI